MKLATWNVNSIKVRLPQLLAWLGRERPDVVCLQETKTEDLNFPKQDLREAGYHSLFRSASVQRRGDPRAGPG